VELVPVPFYGDTILAVRNGDKVMVSVKRICESLDINFSTQTRKLNSCHWAGVVEMTIPDSKGVEQSYAMISADSLPMWMVTIHPNKIAEEARPKLRAYQLEARDVLARHFMPVAAPVVSAPAIKPTSSTLDLIGMAELLTNSFRKHYELEQSVVVVQAGQLQLEAKNRDLELRLARTQEELVRATTDAARAVRTVTSESGWFTLVTWAERQGIFLAPPKDGIEGKVVTGMCKDRGIEPGKWNGPRYPVGTYPEHILYLWLDNYRSRGTDLRVANPA
jgi:hypothetical protein